MDIKLKLQHFATGVSVKTVSVNTAGNLPSTQIRSDSFRPH